MYDDENKILIGFGIFVLAIILTTAIGSIFTAQTDACRRAVRDGLSAEQITAACQCTSIEEGGQ